MGHIAIIQQQPTVVKLADKIKTFAVDEKLMQSLKPVDRAILAATNSDNIGSINIKDLCARAAKLFSFVAIDIGYKKPTDEMEWNYIVTRSSEVLQRYYSDLTLQDVKIAFEMLATGELDPYLPKNSNGDPDRAHYQSFGIDFLGKVLNAYKKRRDTTITAAQNYAREHQPPIPALPIPEDCQPKNVAKRCYEQWLDGVTDWGIGSEMITFNYLKAVGYIPQEITVSDDDKKQALEQYLLQAKLGMKSRFSAFWVRHHGTEAREIQPQAYSLAVKNAIIDAFKEIKTKKSSIR